MPCARLKPGPRPTSCLTCRQRRKKCDLTRPCCERCLKGGYECLGYNDEETRENSPQDDPNVLVSSRLEHDALAIPVLPERPEPSTLEIDPKELLKFKNILHDGQQYFDSTCENPDLSSSIFGPAILYGMVGSIPWADDNYIGTHTLDYNIYSRSQRQDQFTTYGPLDKVSNLHAEYGESRLSTIIRALFSSIPPSIDATHIMRDGHIVHVIGEYQVQRVRNWFTIPSPSVRDYLITRVKGSKAMVGAMYLGAKLFQAVGENPGGTGVLKCIGWIEKLEQRFDNDFYSSSTLNEAGDYLLAELELAFLKSSIISSISGYSVLQKVLPRFLHLLAADPSLYSEGSSGSLVVSFPRTFGASRFELKRFVMFDTTATLVLGVPPLVEYGYDGECDPVAHALEFIHGAPVVFVETIAQVNSWRVGSRVPLDDWWILEKRVMDWQAQPLVGEEEEPTIESVAKLAVQESWRQVALIYIYMGICGVSSHDTRVQTSIRQIIQLGEVVADLPIGVHMFVHCVVAGLGARYERHRAIVRKKLLSFEGLRVWLFRGHDFTQILDHLWHGADGAPVTWDDYVRSRCVVAPL
ncbi:unnamed protein product [Rhizoctonia solani]|uniref:Zn(2)-C6 fungal-type domain-containing protein n=1 Tax=Rhizoctonia solani TaxID=456999 RepID=A0A8H3E8R7_9AGAM|nr:unnamed protein product [Rhizoctonia solani]